MSPSESKETIQAKHLFDEGKFEEVFLLLNKIDKKEDLTDLDRLTHNLIKSSVFFRFRDDEECFKYAEKAYQESQELGLDLYSIDALLNMAWALLWLGDFEKAFELTLRSENILKTLTNISTLELERKEANILYIKASGYWFLANVEKGLDCAKRSLELRQKLGIKHEIVESYSLISGYYTYFKDDLDYALELLEQCQSYAIDINHPWVDSFIPKNLGVIFYMKGDLKKALIYYKKILAFFEEKNNLLPIITTISDTGNIYREMGDLDQCLVYLKRGFEIAKKTRNNWVLSEVTSSLIEVFVVKGDIERAQKYLEQLEAIYKQEDDNKQIEQSYFISKALVLKSSPRIHNRVKAQELLKQIIDGEMITNEHIIIALLNQSELLLEELHMTNSIEIIDEIQPLINKLLEIAVKLRSYWFLAESYVLQAKLSLLTLDLKGARRLFTQAQRIAEKHGMHRIAAKISIEHDELLQKLSIWEKLKDSESSLSERFKLTNLNEQMTYMIQKRRSEVPEIIEENPVMILVISEGGLSTFSKLFTKTLDIEENLISSFLATFNTFSGELFSEGLDRATFGQYTLLMKRISTFLVCYLFKGHSFSAQKKIQNFVENIKNNEDLLEKFNKYCQTNRIIKLEDVPILKSLITEIFIKKNIK